MVCVMSGCLAVSPQAAVSTENAVEKAVFVKAVSTKKEVVIGELFQYTLVIKGDFDRAPQVVLPDLKAFSMLGNTQSKGYSQDGKVTQIYFLFEYTLKPQQAGIFTISPVRIVSDGKTYESETITLTVREPSPAEKPQKENPSEKTIL
jgi:hypothetical protein